MKHGVAQNKPIAKTEKIFIEYNDASVPARRLIVSSNIPINLNRAWTNVQTPRLLQFIAKGMIHFKSVNGGFPNIWKQGKTYKTKMYLFGFIPLGTHYLTVEKIDTPRFEIQTKEWDLTAKVWNHHVKLRKISDGQIEYTDSIIIYGGLLTKPIVLFAKIFYKHRQKRWQLVANQKMSF